MQGLKRATPWLLAWVLLAGAGCAWLAQQRLQALHDAFDTDARIAHRLLSQRMVQHEAILDTLVLLQPRPTAAQPAPWDTLTRLYPQVREVVRHTGGGWPGGWPATSDEALQRSGASDAAALAPSELARGQLYLVRSGSPASWALRIDLRATALTDDWPLPPAASPVRAWLTLQGQQYLIQAGMPATGRWRWTTEKTLAAASQPLQLHLQQTVHAAMLPWAAMLGWMAGCALALAVLRQFLRQRVARRRAEQLLQLGQVARLNTLGELAAGMAHELNQPLTAVLASTQAAQRLLADGEADPAAPPRALQQALEQTVAQARRAAAVVSRLRRLVERPGAVPQTGAVPLAQAIGEVLYLLEPQLQQHKVEVRLHLAPDLPPAGADPVALQQILHNLLLNALQALQAMPAGQRRIHLGLQQRGQMLHLTVHDTGPGVAPDMRTRLFTPFATGRVQGLGLGLTLSQSLAESMGGSLQLAQSAPQHDAPAGGACFELRLPVAPASTPAQPARR